MADSAVAQKPPGTPDKIMKKNAAGGVGVCAPLRAGGLVRADAAGGAQLRVPQQGRSRRGHDIQVAEPGTGRDVGLRVSDGRGGVGTDHVTITVGSGGPTATIDAPTTGALWKVGDPIGFSGHATDPVDGTVPAPA